MIFFFDSTISDIRNSNDTSGAAVSLHGQRYCADAEGLCLLETHSLSIIRVAISVDEATT